MPAPQRLDDEQIARIRETFEQTGTIAGTARELGHDRSTVRRYLATTSIDASAGAVPAAVLAAQDAEIPQGEPAPDPGAPVTIREDGKGNGTVEFLADREIRTVEDAVAYAGVDLSAWFVDRYECTAWTTQMRVRRGQDAETGRQLPDQPFTKQNWRISIKLRRILPASLAEAADKVFARLEARAPKSWPYVARPASRENGHLLAIGLFDVHFGKLCWGAETGDNYDLGIAERVFGNAIEDLVAGAAGFPIDEILLPLGSDFFHVDNTESATTRGTRVDSDGRYAKMIEVGEAAVVSAVERLRDVAPVKLCWVPGNHDRVASYHLARTVAAWFRSAPDVSVDCAPSYRKYHAFGANLIGITHGDQESPRSLPAIMAQECRAQWAGSRYCEWLTGHYHKAKRTETTALDTYDGVVVRTLQSLSGRDGWHHARGYVGGRRAGEALIYARRGGMVANLVADARED